MLAKGRWDLTGVQRIYKDLPNVEREGVNKINPSGDMGTVAGCRETSGSIKCRNFLTC
jgi:hypothetical protein